MRKPGFTLVELMLVLVLISVLTAFAIPNLMESQKSGRETGVEKALKTLMDAEASWMKSDPDNDGKDFAYNLAILHDQTDGMGNAIGLIPSTLSGGSKEGYAFGALTSYDTAGGTDPKFGFAYYAEPEQYGTSGRRSYIVNHSGAIFYKDNAGVSVAGAWPDTANDSTWVSLGS